MVFCKWPVLLRPWTLVFVALLALGPLSASIVTAQQEDVPPQDLQSLLVDVTDLYPDAAIVDEIEITEMDFAPRDSTAAEINRALFIQGQGWVFEVDGFLIAFAMIEFQTNQAATMYAKKHGAVDPDFPQLTVKSDQTDFSPAYIAAVGRMTVAVGALGGSGTYAEAEEIVRNIYLVQYEKIPFLDDLAKHEALTIGQRFAYAWSATTGGMLIVGLMFGIGLGLATDQGLREWLRNRTKEPRPLAHQVDVTSLVKPVIRRGALVTLMRVLVLAIVTMLALGWPGVSVVNGFIIIGVVVFIWQAVENGLRGKNTTSDQASGGTSSLLHLLGGAGSAAVLVGGVLMLSAPIGDILSRAELAPSRMFLLAAFLFGLEIISWSRRPIRFVKRLLQPKVRQQIETDNRAPILLLRSFQDDSLEMRPPYTLSGAFDTFSGESLVRFEEVIAWSAWERGPLRAIGQPGTFLQPLGAARDYFDNDSWKDAVNEIAAESQAFVLIAGRSPGLVWEINNIRAQGMLAKTIFVFAPVDPEEEARRVAVVCTTLDLNPAILDAGASRHILMLGFDSEGNPLVYTAAGRTADAYVLALGQALAAVSDISQVSRPAEWAFLESPGPATDLAKFDKSRDQSSKPIISWLSDIAGSFIRV